MRARCLDFVPPLVVLAIAVFCSPVSAGPWIPAPGEYYSEFRATQTSIRSAYDSEGARTPSPADFSFEERSLLSRNEIGWKSWMSVIVGLPIKSVSVASGAPSVTGLADSEFGIKIKLVGGPTAMALEGIWQAPLGYQRNVLPSLGEGVQQMVGRLSFGSGLLGGRGFLQVAGGYRYFAEQHGLFGDQGDAVEGDADLGLWLGSSILLSGHYEASFARGDTDPPSTHVVGPELRYRVDERVDVFAGSRHTAAGKNAFHQDGVYVGVAARHSSLHRAQGFLGGTRRP